MLASVLFSGVKRNLVHRVTHLQWLKKTSFLLFSMCAVYILGEAARAFLNTYTAAGKGVG